MEPSITTSLDLFAPFGSSPANGKAPLKGSFGNAVLDNIPDYYSQLLTKVALQRRAPPNGSFSRPTDGPRSKLMLFAISLQSNLSNPPTPPSSLPPTPPPSVQHKLLNGVTSGEELSGGRKDPEPTEEPMGNEIIRQPSWHDFYFLFFLSMNDNHCLIIPLQRLLPRR